MFGHKKKDTLDNGLPAPGQANVVPTQASAEPVVGSSAAGSAEPATPAQPAPTQNPVGYPGAWPGAQVIDLRGNPEMRNEVLKAALGGGGSNALESVINQAMQAAEAYQQNAIQAMAAASNAAPPAEDPLDRIKKLNDLRLRGALTDAEFEAQKKKILGEA